MSVADGPVTARPVANRPVTANLLWLRPGAVGGSENYALGLLAALAEHAPELEMSVLASPETLAKYPWLTERFATQAISTLGGRAVRFAKEWRLFHPKNASDRFSLVHHLGGYVGGRLRKPRAIAAPPATPAITPPMGAVITVHDTQFLDLPNNFSRVRWRFLWSTLSAAVVEPNVICTVSDFTARQLAKHFEIDPQSCYVIPPVITTDQSLASQPNPSQPNPSQPPASQPNPSQHRDLNEPYVLYPAVTWAHKRHSFLIKVAEQFTKPGRFSKAANEAGIGALRFVFCGAAGPTHKSLLKLISASPAADRIDHLGRVSQHELAQLYRNAVATVFPSQYEGVGLPVLEAMARGCPVIASDHEGVLDTAGNAAVSLPLDSELWADTIIALAADDAHRSRLIDLGRKRVEQFTAQRSASAQLAAYRQAGKNSAQDS